MAGLRLLGALLLATTCLGYPSFRDRLPNGYNVPHPCQEGEIWVGVGHENMGGGGARNIFGVDFKNNGLVWDAKICNMDSDGDGLTNGQELGDPDCEWTSGSVPKYNTSLSHPGICEPFSSSKCDGRPSYVSCEDTSQSCDVKNEAETFDFTIRFPETDVPAKETTYTCVTFEFPSDQAYHLVAYDAIISNIEVMHHTLVFGCEGVTEAPGPLMEPTECGAEMEGCRSIVALWGPGISGDCLYDQMGHLIGQNGGYKYAVMQHHWNNPQLRSDYKDSSGMTFHLTPKLRPHNAGVLMIGQYHLEIPPNTLAYTTPGSCHGECTKQIMDGPIYISTVINHMHLLGRAQYTEKISNGESMHIAMDPVYDYNTPVSHVHSEPVQMNPGDELKTTCMFRSTTRNLTTNFGEATFDEMCLAFLTYYPKENFRTDECVAWKSLSHCELNFQKVRRGCDFEKIFDYSHPETLEMYTSVNTLCSVGKCRKECLDYVRELKKQPCFSGDVGSLYRASSLRYSPSETRYQTIEWFSRLDSCDKTLAIEKYLENNADETNAGVIMRPAHLLTTLVVSLVMFL